MPVALPRNSLEIAGLDRQDPILIRLLKSSEESRQTPEITLARVPDIDPESPDLLDELQIGENPDATSTSIAGMDTGKQLLKRAASGSRCGVGTYY